MLLFQSSAVVSQDALNPSYSGIRGEAEKRYGPDADLLNGEKYHFSYRSDRGTPFYEVQGKTLASVQIKGKLYEDQKIRYDLYNQLMVLDFTDRSGAPGSIVLTDQWIDHLILGGIMFKRFPDERGIRRFGQVIFEGPFSCVYFWGKKRLPDLHEGENHFYFSEPFRVPVLVIQGETFPFSGNGSFLKCLPEEYLAPVKKYLKEQRIRVKKAPDQQMRQLMEFINQLAGNDA